MGSGRQAPSRGTGDHPDDALHGRGGAPQRHTDGAGPWPRGRARDRQDCAGRPGGRARPGARRGWRLRRRHVARGARPWRAGERAGSVARARPGRGTGGLRARLPGVALRGAGADARRPVPQAGARAMSWLGAAIDWQSRAVVARHLRVYLRNWHTAFLPPVLEPVTMLVAFGVGLGGYVASLSWQGRPVEYMTYVAPGLLAYATFMTAIFQSLFGAFIRMRYQKTWEGQLTTQIELAHVVWGEVLWAGLLATMYVAIVAGVIAAFDATGLVTLRLAWLPALLPVSFVAACAFGAI